MTYRNMRELRKSISPDVAVIDDAAPRPPIALSATEAAAVVDSGPVCPYCAYK